MLNKKIQEFYKDAAPYFEQGYIREVYSDGKYCICNACSITYVLFNYVKDKDHGQIGIQMAAEEVKVILKEEGGYEAFIEYLHSNYEDFKTRVFLLNDTTKKMMDEYLKRPEAGKPSELIDKGLEEELKETTKNYYHILSKKD